MAQIIELTNRGGLDFLLGFVDRARNMRPVLAEIGEDHNRPHADIRDLNGWAERFRAGVARTADERTGMARDFDLRA